MKQKDRIQVSEYPQNDGTRLFTIEILYPDGKWDILDHTRDIGRAWVIAGEQAAARSAVLLPESLWPNRAPDLGSVH
jgi:hypothetical protein